jgi:hypothetical protein
MRPDPRQARWFEPLHVRDAAAARERIAGQVAVGADVVTAPTWLTHRRALLPVGETRQARAWTAAAVRVAREAIEMGLERRAEAQATPSEGGAAAPGEGGAEPPGEDSAEPPGDPPRPTPLLAASLPALDETPETGAGRLLPRAAASARDYREQAGWLAETEPDLLLVEGQAGLSELCLAMGEARATGLRTWVAVSAPELATGATDPLLEAVLEAGVELVMAPSPLSDVVRDAGLAWGGLVDPSHRGIASDSVPALLGSDAGAIGLLDGAGPDRLASMRAAIDEHERAELGALRARADRWWRHVDRAAAMAPGGAALWLGRPDRPAPAGFEWLLLPPERAQGLPEDRFRLVVDPIGGAGACARWAPVLELGGILVTSRADGRLEDPGLRLLVLDDSAEPWLAILRREG